MIFEYDLDNPATWEVRQPPPCDSSVDMALIGIGGVNRFAGPMLRRVWGGTHRSKGILVYKLCDTEPMLVAHQFRKPRSRKNIMCEVPSIDQVPKGVVSLPIYRSAELGELRWFIQRWLSPEQLEAMGYFDPSLQNTLEEEPKDLKAMRLEVAARIKAGESPDVALAHVEGEMDRLRNHRTDREIATYFDPFWRQYGDYQLFYKVQTANGMYHPLDGEALEAIAAMWVYNENTSPAQREADEQAEKERQARERRQRREELWNPDTINRYADESGAVHTLWEGEDGSANAQIDFTL